MPGQLHFRVFGEEAYKKNFLIFAIHCVANIGALIFPPPPPPKVILELLTAVCLEKLGRKTKHSPLVNA